MKRLVEPELLDTLPPDAPRAIRSRHDLRRVNWWMNNPGIMARALQNHLTPPLKKITELGAGDGSFLLRVAQKFAPFGVPPSGSLARQREESHMVLATLLDQQKNVSAETFAAFTQSGWHAEAVIADVFDWSPSEGAEQVVIANLFLHHFENDRLAELLYKVSQNAKLFIAIEPRRSALPSLAGKLLWLIGCNDVTRHDAAISIRAGFAGEEISALWPDKINWQLNERRAGLFSHLFIARRRK
jgi:hypothetical protein